MSAFTHFPYMINSSIMSLFYQFMSNVDLFTSAFTLLSVCGFNHIVIIYIFKDHSNFQSDQMTVINLLHIL